VHSRRWRIVWRAVVVSASAAVSAVDLGDVWEVDMPDAERLAGWRHGHESLADVVAQIREAVAGAGHADRAAWLEQREHALRSDDVEAQRAARIELSGVVLGMGGLTDMYYGSTADQQRVEELIDQMWAAVKP
jgi:hypothetical protein